MSGVEAVLTGRVVVLSPHLDDAVLSLGAAIADASARAEITMLTVLGDDPGSDRPASPWDARAGFRTEGEAARARREEDAEAAAIVGARPVWLPYGDMQYGRGADDDAIWGDVATHLADADVVLVPGYPLTHPDHAWLAALALERLRDGRRVFAYLEQPYVFSTWWKLWRRPRAPGPIPLVEERAASAWRALPASPGAVARKHAALAAYRSQVRLLGRGMLRRLARYEAARGGESVAPISTRNQRS